MVRKRFKLQPWEIFPCPRCASPDTRFFCYNGRDGTKPKHYCNACHRYWIRGGTLRHVKRVPKARRPSTSRVQPPSPGAVAGELPSSCGCNDSAVGGGYYHGEASCGVELLPAAPLKQETVEPLDIRTWVDEELNRILQEELWAAVSSSGDGEEIITAEGDHHPSPGFQWQQLQCPWAGRGCCCCCSALHVDACGAKSLGAAAYS